MSIKLFNTLSRKKETFTPLVDGEVGMYICGPTVYSDCHIGHVMGPVLFDSIARWFAQRSYKVRFVNNITDIDDKIIKRANDTGEPWLDITKRYTQQYFDLLAQLKVTTVTDHPKCTEYIDEMISYIQGLIDENKAYVAEDGVYFDVEAHECYGKLSGRKLEDTMSGARVQAQCGLRHSADFCLWKLAKPGEPSWESPFGAGRPGWHIECSVMSNAILGDTFDIHGGGDDLKFPHHENEIAQGEAHGGDYAKAWMHNGLIQYEGEKVGKSDPRMQDPDFAKQFNALYLLETHGPDVIRYFILRGHYRKPFDFAPKEIESAAKALKRVHRALRQFVPAGAEALSYDQIAEMPLPEGCAQFVATFGKNMDDDFNTGNALAQVFSLVGRVKKAGDDDKALVYAVADQLLKLLGIDLTSLDEPQVDASDVDVLDGVMQLVIKLRAKARADKDFATSDEIRDQLGALGLVLKDSPEGCTWSFKED